MPPKAPDWWNKKWSLRSLSLIPAATVYDQIARFRFFRVTPYKSRLPVICIGNFTIGGAGKTPTAIYVSELLRSLERTPIFLTRGYGGQIKGPHLVQETDSAQDVGDEPLLLAQYASVVVSADRAKGAAFIERCLTEGVLQGDVILMDDGFQNPHLHKDFSLVVVDGEILLGNARVFPAGPLRASLNFQKDKADAVLIIGGSGASLPDMPCPQLQAKLVPLETGTKLKGQKVIAYCGIARPQKFHASLCALGIDIAAIHDFPDHHHFTEDEVRHILQEAEQTGHTPVTTEKDWVRLSPTIPPFSDLKEKSAVLVVDLVPSQESEEKLTDMLEGILKKT